MISIIIPTLNESLCLPETLRRIQANDVPHEIVVVDAGSLDGTARVAESAGCILVSSDGASRSRQMNLGALRAKGNILFFLHADTWIGRESLGNLARALSAPRVAGGGFKRCYRGGSWLLSLTCCAANLRSWWLGWHLGDQGIFARRDAFDQVGGFGDLPIFEDLDFCRRLSRVGKLVSLSPAVASSARRFDSRGAVATTLFDLWLTCRYLAGTPPERLAAAFTRWKRSANQVRPLPVQL